MIFLRTLLPAKNKQYADSIRTQLEAIRITQKSNPVDAFTAAEDLFGSLDGCEKEDYDLLSKP